jgi:hypothetical protein
VFWEGHGTIYEIHMNLVNGAIHQNNTPCRNFVDINNQSMETTSGVMNHASDIVLLESDMYKVTFANVPLRVFNLDSQGAGEFDLTSRQVRKFRKDSSLRTIKVFFHKNQTIPDRAARQCFKGQLPCVPLVFMLDMLDLLILRKLSGVEFSTLGVLLEQINASGFHLCQGPCLMLTGVTQSSQIMLLLRVLCPKVLRRLWVASMTISIMWMLMAMK